MYSFSGSSHASLLIAKLLIRVLFYNVFICSNFFFWSVVFSQPSICSGSSRQSRSPHHHESRTRVVISLFKFIFGTQSNRPNCYGSEFKFCRNSIEIPNTLYNVFSYIAIFKFSRIKICIRHHRSRSSIPFSLINLPLCCLLILKTLQTMDRMSPILLLEIHNQAILNVRAKNLQYQSVLYLRDTIGINSVLKLYKLEYFQILLLLISSCKGVFK